MKKNYIIWITILLVLSVFANAAAQDDTVSAVPEEFKGVWVCGRAEIQMIREDSGYLGVITWPASYAEHVTWQYTLLYDPEAGCLSDSGTGVKSTTVFADDGEEESYTENYTDGAARFRISDTGMLLWEDLKEDAGKDMEFEKADFTGLFPTKEELVENYFHVIGGYHQGTAGASLAAAKAAYQAYGFAFEHQLWNADIPALRKAILEAWESMTDAEQKVFDANFIDEVRLIDSCLNDWEPMEGVFADAGVSSMMGELLKDTGARVSWATLVSHTLTLGNTEGD